MNGFRGKAAGVLAAATLAIAAAPAGAGTHGFVSLQFGLPLAPAPPYYYYYPPPPAYYYYYAPPAPAGPVVGQSQQKDCREYQATAVIDGKSQPIYGTVCLQPDGTWRITR
ncbi:MAG TPA: hypothetical protein VFK49_00470 [Stellaceae bacterium]|nr:hypothetical protein [Stellaceae bacterium]